MAIRQNVGALDRALRIVVGLALATQIFIGLQTPWAWFCLVPIVTGSLGYCGVYGWLGISTCGSQR